MTRTTGPKIVVVGAGFAGLSTVRHLAKSAADIILIDRNSYHTFVPLLYQVATGFVEPGVIAYPIRHLLRRYRTVRFLRDTVTQVNFDSQIITLNGGSLGYDYLVIATGSQTQFFQVLGAPDHTFPLRTLNDAVTLHQQILRCIEAAVIHPEARSSLLTFAVVGGGPTGVEMAGALAEFVNESVMRDYPELGQIQARILLIQSGDRLLPGLPPKLGRHAAAQLRRRGVKVHLGVKVNAVSPTTAKLSDGLSVDTATVVWAAGVKASPPALNAISQTKAEKILVQSTLQLDGHPEVYVIGDTAEVEQEPLVGVAPEALQQGKAVAENIQRQINGQLPKPFQYFNKGRAAIIARNAGVAHLLGRLPVTGVLGWLTWLGVHLYYLPGFFNRVVLLMSWLRDYVLRDRAHRQIFEFRQPQDMVDLGHLDPTEIGHGR
ncbi:MAG: NAD(P)/FAD-dependent oxidoreductase [Elainellaceae cyanobacterium]